MSNEFILVVSWKPVNRKHPSQKRLDKLAAKVKLVSSIVHKSANNSILQMAILKSKSLDESKILLFEQSGEIEIQTPNIYEIYTMPSGGQPHTLASTHTYQQIDIAIRMACHHGSQPHADGRFLSLIRRLQDDGICRLLSACR